jgi:hypothetical protein
MLLSTAPAWRAMKWILTSTTTAPGLTFLQQADDQRRRRGCRLARRFAMSVYGCNADRRVHLSSSSPMGFNEIASTDNHRVFSSHLNAVVFKQQHYALGGRGLARQAERELTLWVEAVTALLGERLAMAVV